MSKDTENSRPFKEAVRNLCTLKSEKLIKIFIQSGPEGLRTALGIEREDYYRMVFDELVFNQSALKKCVETFMPYFKYLVVEGGPQVLRRVFEIEEQKYDSVFDTIFELVCIKNGALYDHVFMQRNKYVLQIINNDTRNLRRGLCLSGKKFDDQWYGILELLQDAVCKKVYPEQKIDNGMRTFARLMNVLREQRSLRSFKGVWEYSNEVGK